jgi:hypothetical protein
MRTTALHALALFGASLFATAAQSYDVTQEGYDAEKSYNNTAETIINGANVNRLRRLFKVKLPVGVDSSPVYLQGIDTVKGSKMDVLFLTTVEGQILAINAHTGATIWTKQRSRKPANSMLAAVRQLLRRQSGIAHWCLPMDSTA